MPKASYIALDVASTSGFASWQTGMAKPSHGSVKFAAVDLGERAACFVDWLLPKLAADEVTDLVIEPPVPIMGVTNITTTVWLQGMYLRVLEICHRRRIIAWPVSESTWRSWFLGATRAPRDITAKNERRKWLKKRCMDECRLRGFDPKDDNAADALALLDYIRAQHDKEYAMTSKIMLKGEAA